MHWIFVARDPAPAPQVRASWLVTVLAALLVVAGFELEAWPGARFGFPGAADPLFRISGPILLTALVLSPIRAWWVLGLAALLGDGVVNLKGEATPELVLLGFLAKASPVALAALGIRCWGETPVRLDTVRKVVGFLVLAVLGVPLVESFLKSALGVSSGWGDDDWRPCGVEVLAVALSIFILVPVLVGTIARLGAGLRGVSLARGVEAWVLALMLVASGAVALDRPDAGPDRLPTLLFTPLPALLWMALRFGPGGVSLALMALAGFALAGAGRGLGPFRRSSAVENTVALQLVLLAVGVPCQLLSARFREWRRDRATHSEAVQAETRRADLAAVLAVLPGRPNDLEIIQGLHQRIADLLEVAGSALVEFDEETVSLPTCPPDSEHERGAAPGESSEPTTPVMVRRSTSVAIVSGCYHGPRDGLKPPLPPFRPAREALAGTLARIDSRTDLHEFEEHFRLQNDTAAARICIIPQDRIRIADGGRPDPRVLGSSTAGADAPETPDGSGPVYSAHQNFFFELHLQRQDGECRWIRVLSETRIAARVLPRPLGALEPRPPGVVSARSRPAGPARGYSDRSSS